METPMDGNELVLLELRRLHSRMDRMEQQLAGLQAAAQPVQDLLHELGPIGKEMMRSGTEKLGALEKRGYFTFGAELMQVVDQVVSQTSPEDLRALGAGLSSILAAVRSLTQPEVVELAAEAGALVQHPEQVKPLGIWGMMSASRDEEVQRGLAVLFELLRRVGHVGQAVRGRDQDAVRLVKSLPPPSCHVNSSSEKLANRLAPRRGRSPEAAPSSSPASPALPSPEAEVVDPQRWTKAIAESAAAELGLVLGPDHWRVIDFVRADYAAHGASPNIRRITMGTGLSTRDLYTLFPKAPGKSAARVAGVPKPAGCI
ncbi:MAG TPA: TusE/DsrC/DsvC family sulfur relay protein [Myxococcota bacterium]|nr:TusE/DsrC/DsvC family sulfur relay protein [Myxococcota bacterium]